MFQNFVQSIVKLCFLELNITFILAGRIHCHLTFSIFTYISFPLIVLPF